MRILVVAQEFPYPPIHGGRADTWRRLRALSELDHSTFLASWSYQDDVPSPLEHRAVEAVCDEVRTFTVDRSMAGLMRRVPLLPRMPLYIAARVLSRKRYEPLLRDARQWKPDAVLLEGIQGAWLGRRLADQLGCSLLYRAQNVEHRYLRGQAWLARSMRARLSGLLAARGMERWELEVHDRSLRVFDISMDDLRYWEARGFTNGVWVPPLLEGVHGAGAPHVAENSPDVDIAYLGNLNAPNNVDGLLWFLKEALPRLRRLRPQVTVLIGGSRPTPALLEACSSAEGVTLIADVADPNDVLGRARILVNPVWMSSGVNLKSIDMLATGKPVVSTSFGVTGLPEQARSLFGIADDAETFAAACASALEGAPELQKDRLMEVLELFGPDAVARSLPELPR